DIGLRMHRNAAGETGFEVLVGGGLGRTPYLAHTIRDWLAPEDLLAYVESILRIYNIYGRRDNIHKARIKIIVNQLGIDRYRELVEEDFAASKGLPRPELPPDEVERIAGYFAPPPYETLEDCTAELEKLAAAEPRVAEWLRHNVTPHKQCGYAIVNVSLKAPGAVPGDITAECMDALADLADAYSFGELRVNHRQNLVLPYVRQSDLYAVWTALDPLALATPNLNLLSDLISCPGLDYCALANARSIPVARDISARFVNVDRLAAIGPLTINVSGCMNACGHHHVGNIGILGVDKRGKEFFQLTLG